jgi:hypothetical protein
LLKSDFEACEIMNTITTNLAGCVPTAFIVSTLGCSSHDFAQVSTIKGVGPITPALGPFLTVKPRATIPGPSALPAEHGIYKFEIAVAGSADFFTYVGETTNLRGRMTEYGEMVRALVALYQGCRVVLDSNSYRYIHYAIANAILMNQDVTVRFVNGQKFANTQIRKREELLALTDIVHSYQNAAKFHLVLNCMGKLKTVSQSLLSGRWQAVQALL